MNNPIPALNTENYRRIDITFSQDSHLTLRWVFAIAGEPYIPEGVFQLDVHFKNGEKRTYVQGLSLTLTDNELLFDQLLKGEIKAEYRLHEVLSNGKKKPFLKGKFESVFDLVERELEYFEEFQIIHADNTVNVAVSVLSAGGEISPEDIDAYLQSLTGYGTGKVLTVTSQGIQWITPGPVVEAPYLNTEQSYTAICPSGYDGDPVTVVKAAGLYSSPVSVEAANALALAAAQAEAFAALVCELIVVDPGNNAFPYTFPFQLA